MAIEQFLWDRIKQLPGRDVVCLGYPDLLLTEELYARERKDADGIRKWHRWNGSVYDADEAFHDIGKRAVYLDIHASRGKEIIVDLNKDLSRNLSDRGDIVIDCGTIEHCFNIGQAFANCAALCRVGGTVLHTNPLNATNHGFYSISPTAYVDFYEGRGFQIEWLEAFTGPKEAREFSPVPLTGRFGAPENSWLVVEARKTDRAEEGWPMQSKYRANPDLRV